MSRNRRIIVYIATSADGFIARKDGSVDWLDRPHPKGAYGMGAFLKATDTILWGRKTFEQSFVLGGGPDTFGGGFKHYVFTRSPGTWEHKGFPCINTPPAEFAAKLRAEPGKNIWMMGGASIIASFLDAGAIDEFIIHVIPVMLGEGIPLLGEGKRTVDLHLVNTRSFSDGVVRLHYSVSSQPNRNNKVKPR